MAKSVISLTTDSKIGRAGREAKILNLLLPDAIEMLKQHPKENPDFKTAQARVTDLSREYLGLVSQENPSSERYFTLMRSAEPYLSE